MTHAERSSGRLAHQRKRLDQQLVQAFPLPVALAHWQLTGDDSAIQDIMSDESIF